MARNRKEPKAKRQRAKELRAEDIKLQQPDRSAPTEQTLLDIAHQRDLFAEADRRTRANKRARQGVDADATDDQDDEPPVLSAGAERFLEAALYTVTMAMMHLTFDVLVQHQYGTQVNWPDIWVRTGRAWAGELKTRIKKTTPNVCKLMGKPVFLLLFYPLHPHEANQRLLPGLPAKYQKPLWQALFFVMSTVSGCYLIYISNTFGYLAVMKQAPPLGCLWVWSVIELELNWAVASLAVAGGFLWQGGYSIY